MNTELTLSPVPAPDTDELAFALFGLTTVPRIARASGMDLCLLLDAEGHAAMARALLALMRRHACLLALRARALAARLLALRADTPAHAHAEPDFEEEENNNGEEILSSPEEDEEDAPAHVRTHEEASSSSEKKDNAAGAASGPSEAAVPVDYRRWTSAQFRRQAEHFRAQLPADEFERFVAYWQEADPAGRMRFQKQRSFSFLGRMLKWRKNTMRHDRAEELALEQRLGSARMEPPSADEVAAECTATGVPQEVGTAFFDHYQANGWRMGQTPMADWRSGLRKWAARERKEHDNLKNNPLNRNHHHATDNEPSDGGGSPLSLRLDGLCEATINAQRDADGGAALFEGVGMDSEYVLATPVG